MNSGLLQLWKGDFLLFLISQFALVFIFIFLIYYFFGNFFFFFLVWTIFMVFIEFVTILLLFYILVFWPPGLWHLSSPARDRTCTPYIGR